MKKSKKKLVVLIIAIAVIVAAAYPVGYAVSLFFYPGTVSFVTASGPGVRFPSVTVGTSSVIKTHNEKLEKEITDFTDGCFNYVKEKQAQYTDLTLTYTLKEEKKSTTVIFTGSGTNSDGVVTEIHDELVFDLVSLR